MSDQPVRLEQLSIFQEKQGYFPEWGIHVHAGIIGTSHFVQLKYDDGTYFTEMFACDLRDDKEANPLCFLPIEKLSEPLQINRPSIHYRFTQKRISYTESEKDITNWAQQTQASQPFIFLEYHFEIEAQDGPASRTILAIRKTKAGIQIKTVHEYQEEDAIIVSESFINNVLKC